MAIIALGDWCKGKTHLPRGRSLSPGSSPGPPKGTRLCAFRRTATQIMATQGDLYRYHSENFRAVAAGFDQSLAALKWSIGTQQARAISAQTRVAAFLLSAKIEARFYKLLHEPPVPEEFRVQINRNEPRPPSLIQKWERTIEEAFSLYYSVTGSFSKSSAPAAAKEQCTLHLSALPYLASVIELRNKIAHGQWTHALTRKGDALNPVMTHRLEEENLLTLMLKDRVAQIVSEAVNDLVVSKRTHDRDLEIHQKSLRNALRELDTRSYDRFAKNVRAREQRARDHRRKAAEKSPPST